MIKRLLICLFLILFVFELHASTISAYLEIVLSEDGVLIDGETPVTVELLSSDGQELWSEDHNTLFLKGRSALKLVRSINLTQNGFTMQVFS